MTSPSAAPELPRESSPPPLPTPPAPTGTGTGSPAVATTSTAEGSVQVFQPAAEASYSPSPVPDDFFETTVADVQMYQKSIQARSSTDAPLLTAKHRDAAAAEREKKKADKWPTTTIRVKFSDGTQIQRVFPSSSPIQPVYAFVRESLAPSAQDKGFMLYQPPRTNYPEKPDPAAAAAATAKWKPHPNPAMRAHVLAPAGYTPRMGVASTMVGGTGGKETLAQLGLVPQSVLLIRWEDVTLNASGAAAPLTDELRAKAAPLPSPAAKDPPATDRSADTGGKKLTGSAGEVKMPKWLQKGLLKKK